MVTYLGGPWVGALGAMTFYYSVYVKTLLEKKWNRILYIFIL